MANTLEESLNVRFANLERLGTENFNRLQEQIKLLNKRQDKFAEKVKAYDESHMKTMEERHDLLSDRLQLLLEKMTVATECAYSIRHKPNMPDSLRGRKLSALLWALDQPDEWWKEGLRIHVHPGENEKEGLTITEWIKRCFDAYQNFRLEEATNGSELS